MTDATTPHTPGPWWRDDDGFLAAGSGDTYVTIADFDCSDDIDADEREANKSLAMAAPAMRAAISDALAFRPEAFEGDEELNGGDLVEWFSGWRETAKAALAGIPSAAPPAPSDAPADPVKAEMLAALKRLAEVIRDRHRLHGENIGYVLTSLKDAEAIIARAEGRA